MSKRKLNRRQVWRIKKIQDERAARVEKLIAQTDEQIKEGVLGNEQEGLVISHFGQQLDIEAVAGAQQGQIFRCHLRANLDPIVTGDTVIWRPGNPTGVVVAARERRSVLSRPDHSSQLRPVAANIDYIVIVIAPEPAPHANLIDRYLVAAENVAIEPILLLNKIDLQTSVLDLQVNELLERYKALNYQVLTASTRSRDGLDRLQAALDQHTSVFVGQSGVGKSSLINALLPAANIRTSQLSISAAKGKHTTTSARLFHMPGGGDLIDSPGIREFGLWHMDQASLASGFIEFRPLLGHCRFRNCRHQQEPGCALSEAVRQGKVTQERLNSYHHILGSLDNG